MSSAAVESPVNNESTSVPQQPKRPLSSGTVNGLFAVFDKYKSDKAKNTNPTPTSSSTITNAETTTTQDSSSKATLDEGTSSSPNNDTTTSPSNENDNKSSPGLGERYKKKRNSIVPWNKASNSQDMLAKLTGTTPTTNTSSINTLGEDYKMDSRTAFRQLQSYKEKVLELANEKETILSNCLKLQETIEQAHEENDHLRYQLTSEHQQRMDAFNSQTDLKQQLQTVERQLASQSEEIQNLKWLLQNANQQLDASRKERERLMNTAKTLESIVIQNPPSKQMWDLHNSIEQEKTARVKWEQYAKQLEIRNSLRKETWKNDIMQLIVLLVLCFSLFVFILQMKNQTSSKQLPWQMY